METLDNKYDWIEIPILNKDIETLWRSIYNDDVFSIPSFNKILKKHKEIDMGFKDGITYSIEYSSRNKKNGAGWYRCPNSMARRHPDISELKRMSSIITKVYDFIGKGWKPC